VVALHGVDGEIAAADRIAVVGVSGSGKSTLIHLLAGLDQPTAGSIEWPALGPRSSLRPGQVGVVFQSPSLMPALDVIENVGLPLVLGGASAAAARQFAHEALERLGLAHLADRLPDELSGGQAQRVAVARVLADRPRLILADEPTGQIDQQTAATVVDALLDAAAHLDAALVVATHDPAVAARLAIRWLVDDGTVTAVRSRAC
jgi:ABC-type lipoprotein export system ATPase subunit